jgi:haloacetate dehalogenase
LHGFPQNLAMWARVAPMLTGDFTVVCADLRGYGDSSKPTCAPDRSNYSFRTMASDQVGLMKALGFDRFRVVGHDRGGRTAHRMALDHPDVVVSLAVLDIVPTSTRCSWKPTAALPARIGTGISSRSRNRFPSG